MLNEDLDCKRLNISEIERAARLAMERSSRATGVDNIYRDVAKAIAAAIEEYDRQKSE